MPFDRVEAGVFELARRSFGITIRPVTGVDVWHPSVRTYEAFAEDGTRLGFFYTDWFPRESKRGGAWMNGLVAGGPRADGGFDPHVGVVGRQHDARRRPIVRRCSRPTKCAPCSTSTATCSTSS
jgi:oligopeptidase A